MSNLARCRIHGFRSAFPTRSFEFKAGIDLRLLPQNHLGPEAISARGADLLDFAAAVYQIERNLTGRQRTNPPGRFQLRLPLREPDAWSEAARARASALLNLLGNATWELEFVPGKLPPVPPPPQIDKRRVRQVMLFSGGLDSACGAAHLAGQAGVTQTVSFYTRQKELQLTLAKELSLAEPCQWRMAWTQPAGRGHSFFYRSFLFLSLAAVTAATWRARRILQYENGILASSVPPAASWAMTKHAYPRMTALAGELFSSVLGGKWEITNPFVTRTKRECVQAALAGAGKALRPVFARTETCWFHWSQRVPGKEKKKPGVPCGVCVPCILRRTALPDERGYAFDLRHDAIRNHPVLGRAFNDYFVLLRRMTDASASDAGFYAALPAAGRNLIGATPELTLPNLRRLFVTFAGEFMETFRL